jgi:hypothetical protein
MVRGQVSMQRYPKSQTNSQDKSVCVPLGRIPVQPRVKRPAGRGGGAGPQAQAVISRQIAVKWLPVVRPRLCDEQDARQSHRTMQKHCIFEWHCIDARIYILYDFARLDKEIRVEKKVQTSKIKKSDFF